MDAPPLGALIRPCGPVVDAEAVSRLEEALGPVPAAPAPVFAASPYLAGLARRSPERLAATLDQPPAARLAEILASTEGLTGGADALRVPLRRLKADLHLLTAVADLGGVWDLGAVTGALSRFADAAVQAALRAAAHDAREKGRLIADPDAESGPVPGLFGLAMGKHGAFELNYSSDIDLSLFYDPARLGPALAAGVDPQTFVNRIAQALAGLLTERTADGYVFRVDLRLRPDPSSTPPVVAAPAALQYYESVGQNWERAAFIKARPVCGEAAAAAAFMAEMQRFVWRRSLDFAAVSDIQSIKRQIHVHKADERLEAAGCNLKLGRGGIREIEFFAQTQQLILGGRKPALRAPRTVDALKALAEAGHIDGGTATELCEAYVRLRGLEHRVQMLADEQTHILPEDPAARRAVAALAGQGDLAAFDADVSDLLRRVNARYGELFAEAEPLSASHGSLVFTGVEDDPETLATLARMGFSDPPVVAASIRAWHHGRIGATRSARGRELFTRLAPRLLETAAASGAPDQAFQRFALFFAGLSAGVQVQELLLAQPRLLALIVDVLALAPRLAAVLARRPAALDAILDAPFFAPVADDSGVLDQLASEVEAATDFEGAMNAARRIHREQVFRIGVHLIEGRADATAAGEAYTDLAHGCIRTLAGAALKETWRQGGAFEGRAAVVALGRAGSREMTATSDLDLMVVYDAPEGAASAGKGWSADQVYVRFTQRLIAALSAPTAEGDLYAVDMRLRPTGAKGPVAVRLSALADYYRTEAQTWELLALTRGRVVWASDEAFAAQTAAVIEQALRAPIDAASARLDVAEMRALMARQRPARGAWDLKLAPGGLVDCEFAAQLLQLLHAGDGGPLSPSAPEALRRLAADGRFDATQAEALIAAWRLQQDLDQLIRCALGAGAAPTAEPEGFRRRLAAWGGAGDFAALERLLAERRAAARAVFERLTDAATDW